MTTDELKRHEKSVQRQRWFQSTMVSLCTIGVAWGVNTLVSVDKNQAVSDERQQKMEIMLEGAYMARDARRDTAEILRRIDHNEQAIITIDGRLKILEAVTPVKRKRNDASY